MVAACRIRWPVPPQKNDCHLTPFSKSRGSPRAVCSSDDISVFASPCVNHKLILRRKHRSTASRHLEDVILEEGFLRDTIIRCVEFIESADHGMQHSSSSAEILRKRKRT